MNIQKRTPETPGDALRLEGLVTTRVDDRSFEDEVFVHMKSTSPGDRCGSCAPMVTSVHRHGSTEGRYKDVSAWGKKVTIVVDRQRYRCTSCSRTWFETIPALHERRMMTARLEEIIARTCFGTTQINVARMFGIDEGTVRNVFRDYVAAKEDGKSFETPRILGIDEIHLSEVRCVLTNVGRRSVFDILPSRTKENLIPYFEDLPDKRNVEVVVADMWRPYHDLADRFLPGRLVVVDKFHVVRMAHNGLDIVRKAVGHSRTKEERIRLKHERVLLHKRRRNLDQRQSDRVDAWLKAFPELRQAYETKERFTDAFDAPNRREGAKAIERCLRTIPIGLDTAFSELTTALGNWKERVLNYFEEPATNAYTEAVNGLIRLDDRIGRGYSFEVMRARILFDEVARSKSASTRHRRPEQDDDVVGFYDPFNVSDDEDIVEYGPDIATIVAMLTAEAGEENHED